MLWEMKKYLCDMLCWDCCSVSQSCLTLSTPWTAAHQALLSFTIFFLYFKFLCLLYILKFILIWCLFIILFSSFIHSSTRIIFTHTFYAKWCLEFVKNICHASSKWLLILHLEEWSVFISIPKKGNAKE